MPISRQKYGIFLHPLVFLLFAFEFFVQVNQRLKSFFLELFEFLKPGSNLFFFDDSLNKFFVFFRITKPCKNFHHVIDLFLLFCPGLVQPHLFLDIKKFSTDNKFLPSDSFSQLFVVDIDESKLHLDLLLAVIFIELHLGQEQLNIVIEFYLEISSLWHVADYLCRVGP